MNQKMIKEPKFNIVNLLRLFWVNFQAILDKNLICIIGYDIMISLITRFIYFFLHLSTIHEVSNLVTEAQYVSSYPSIALMINDVTVNASMHFASIREPIFPMANALTIRSEKLRCAYP